MNLTDWTQSPGWIPVVETLLHSLWQAAGIAAILSLAYQRISNPARRYGLALAALGFTIGLSILTWSIRSASPSTSQRHSKPAKSEVQPGLAPPKITSPSHASSTDPAALPHNAPSDLRTAHTSTTSQPHEAATNTHVPWWHPWVVSVWMAGVVVMLFRAGAQIAGADSLRRSAHPIHDPKILELLQHTQRAVGWTRSVTLAISETLTSPAVIGWWSPWILIPGSLFTTLTPEQLRFILLHELAHLRRGDYLTSVAQLILEAVYFFNPAVWWMSQQLRNEREACCDLLAVSRCPIPTAEVDYARTLLQVAEWANRRGSAHSIPLPQAALAMAEPSDPNSLSSRIHRILTPGYRPHLRLTWRAVTLTFTAGVGALLLSAVGARWTVAAVLTPQERAARIEKRLTEHLGEPVSPTTAETDAASATALVWGKIRTADGSPLPKISSLSAYHVRRHQTGIDGVRVSPDGFFTNPAPLGRITFAVDSPGYAPSMTPLLTISSTNPIGPIDIVLSRGFPIECEVVDAAQGKPIVGASVSGRFWMTSLSASTWPLITRTSDASGRVQFGPSDGSLELRVTLSADGYALQEATLSSLTPGKIHRIELKPGRSLSGKVTDRATGKPIPGAVLRILADDAVGARRFGWDDAARKLGETDENGRFRITQLTPGTKYLLAIEAADYGPEQLIVPPDSDLAPDLEIRLGPPRIVRGRVEGVLTNLQSIDKTLNLARTWSEEFQNNSNGYHEWVPVRITNGVGFFAFTNRLAGLVTLSGPGFREERKVTGPIDDWKIVIPHASSNAPAASRPTPPLRDVVYRFQSTPEVSPRGTIRALVPDLSPPLSNHYRYETISITNAEVRLRLPVGSQTHVEPGQTLGFWFAPTEHQTIPDGADPWVINVPCFPAGAIFAQARNSDGSPAGGLFFGVVEVRAAPGRSQKPGPLNTSGDSVENQAPRRWASSALPLGGVYRIYGWRGNSFCQSEPVHLTGSAPDADVTLQFPASRTLRGRILGPNEGPLAGKRVQVKFDLPDHGGFQLQPLTTDSEGRFTLDNATLGVGIGRYSIELRVPGILAREVRLDDAIASTPEGQTIRFETGRTLAGIVIDADSGRAVPNMEIRALDIERRIHPMLETRTDEAGRFEFSSLGDVPYQIYPAGGQLLDTTRFTPHGQTNLTLRVKLYDSFRR